MRTLEASHNRASEWEVGGGGGRGEYKGHCIVNDVSRLQPSMQVEPRALICGPQCEQRDSTPRMRDFQC